MGQTTATEQGNGKGFGVQENVTGSRSIPPPLIHKTVDLACIPEEDAVFYIKDRERSAAYQAYGFERTAYYDKEAAVLMVFTCIDERESDFETCMGIPIGAANVIQTGGSKLGEVNHPVRAYIQRKVKKAHERGKVVLTLFVTHESTAHPDDDSCAAWNHDIAAANQYATERVARFNAEHVDRSQDGTVSRRHLVAIHIKSFTDSEARVWVGMNGETLDPREYAHPNGGGSHVIEGVALEQALHVHLMKIYPYDDPRFEGLMRPQWMEILWQCARMAQYNVGVVRSMETGLRTVEKAGHKGTRVLVGRGWDMYDEPNAFFKVGDFSPDFTKECRIAAKYLIRNGLICAMRDDAVGRSQPVTFHVNVLYEDEPGDRSNSIGHAMDIARTIRTDLRTMMNTAESRDAFDEALRLAMYHEGVPWTDLSLKIRTTYHEDALRDLRIYVSVSKRDTRSLELVATIEDL